MSLQPLRLEYFCTPQELAEAQSLSLRKQIGRGSKWLTLAVLFLVAGGLLAAFWFQIRREIPPKYRPLFFAGVFLLWLFFLYRQRRSRGGQKRNLVEATQDEFRMEIGETKLQMPWSAFSSSLESPKLFVLVDRQKATLFVIPKRAFPDEPSQTWFRDRLALHASERQHTELLQSTGPADESTAKRAGANLKTRRAGITVQSCLTYRDYLDYTFASWFSFGLILGFSAMPVVTGLVVISKPDPRAVFTPIQMLFYFIIPFGLFMMIFLTLVVTTRNWLLHKKHLLTNEIGFSDESIELASPDGVAEVPWSTYGCFKETRRSFFLWKRGSPAWLLIPKRALDSAHALSNFRELLARHLARSTWFFG